MNISAKQVVKVLVKLDPSFKACISPKGNAIVELEKAIYGTIEAANLWYHEAAGKKTIAFSSEKRS
jgi:hypothetical protein